MSTRAYIAIEKETNRGYVYDAIYCHMDGSPDSLGEMLIDFYDDENSVNSLLNKGDVISLDRTPEVSEFFTERGESLRITRNVSFKELAREARRSDSEYLYIFFPEQETWQYCQADDRFLEMYQI